ESTRGELRKGILELPQETADTAAQMRRVVLDQIEALAELNRIVARHGRSLDAVEPARRMEAVEPVAARKMEPAEPAPRRAAARGPPPARSATGGATRTARRRFARFARRRYRAHDRSRGGGRVVGALQPRRTQRVYAQALHHAGPEGVRGGPPQISRRPRLHA